MKKRRGGRGGGGEGNWEGGKGNEGREWGKRERKKGTTEAGKEENVKKLQRRRQSEGTEVVRGGCKEQLSRRVSGDLRSVCCEFYLQ